MVKSKVKGTQFERDAVKILNTILKKSEWRRIAGSGAIGTSLNEPLLTSDIKGSIDALPKTFRVEAKVGYGGATQMSLKKEWLDKNIEEAKNTYSYPMLIGKFSGAREGTKVFVVFDIETFAEIMNTITDMVEE